MQYLMQQYTFINWNTCKYTILLNHNLCTVCTILVFGITCICLYICNKFFFFFCSNQNPGLDNVRINTGSSMHVCLGVWVGVGGCIPLCVHACMCMCVCTGVCVCVCVYTTLCLPELLFSFLCVYCEGGTLTSFEAYLQKISLRQMRGFSSCLFFFLF